MKFSISQYLGFSDEEIVEIMSSNEFVRTFPLDSKKEGKLSEIQISAD